MLSDQLFALTLPLSTLVRFHADLYKCTLKHTNTCVFSVFLQRSHLFVRAVLLISVPFATSSSKIATTSDVTSLFTQVCV